MNKLNKANRKRKHSEIGQTMFVCDISTDDDVWDDVLTPPPSPLRFSPQPIERLENDAHTLMNELRAANYGR